DTGIQVTLFKRGAHECANSHSISFDFSKANRDNLNDFLFSRDFSHCFSPDSNIELAYTHLKENLLDALRQCVPKRSLRSSSHKYPFHIRSLLSRKRKIWNDMKSNPTLRGN